MSRAYVEAEPWRIDQVGSAAQIARYGFTDMTSPDSLELGPLRITWHGDWTRPHTQFIKVTQLQSPNANFVGKEIWSNSDVANDNTLKVFKQAVVRITTTP